MIDVWAAIQVLNEALGMAFPADEKIQVLPNFNEAESLEVSKKILDKAVLHKLDYHDALPKEVEKEILKDWIVEVRRKYLQKLRQRPL